MRPKCDAQQNRTRKEQVHGFKYMNFTNNKSNWNLIRTDGIMRNSTNEHNTILEIFLIFEFKSVVGDKVCDTNIRRIRE